MGRTRFVALLAGAAVLGVGGWLATSRACETPVYRFALYSRDWLPWEYRVYFLHEGEAAEDEATKAIHARLRSLMNSESRRTNLYFRSVDLTDDAQTTNLPPAVRAAWDEAADKSAGLHVVLAPPCRHRPRWTTLFAGRLDEATIDHLIDSPARRAMAASLAKGNIPLILLESDLADANDAAAHAIDETAANVAAGKVRRRGGIGELVPPPEEKPKPRPNGGQPVEQDVVTVGVDLIRVRRDDEAEAYFVQVLMLVEEDLPSLASQPMVFAGYGRGRVGEPFVGKGITPDNLAGELIFLTGACSCEVKDQNPGMDLLTTADWDAAAAAMVERFGEEQGSQQTLSVGELLPSLGSASPQATTPEIAPAKATSGAAPLAGPAAPRPTASPNNRPRTEVAPSAETSGGLLGNMAWTLGIGAGIVTVLMLAISLLYLRAGGK